MAVSREYWDRLGISLSGICLVHCLAFPLVLSVLPMWSAGDTLHEWLHPVFAVILVPTTIFALWRGIGVHGKKAVAIPLLAGLTLVLIAGFFGHFEPGHAREIIVTSAGSILLVIGHFINWREGKRSCNV